MNLQTKTFYSSELDKKITYGVPLFLQNVKFKTAKFGGGKSYKGRDVESNVSGDAESNVRGEVEKSSNNLFKRIFLDEDTRVRFMFALKLLTNKYSLILRKMFKKNDVIPVGEIKVNDALIFHRNISDFIKENIGKEIVVHDDDEFVDLWFDYLLLDKTIYKHTKTAVVDYLKKSNIKYELIERIADPEFNPTSENIIKL